MRAQKREKLSAQVTVLVKRLRALEDKPVEYHEKPIVAVGIIALRDKIREVGRQMEAC